MPDSPVCREVKTQDASPLQPLMVGAAASKTERSPQLFFQLLVSTFCVLELTLNYLQFFLQFLLLLFFLFPAVH